MATVQGIEPGQPGSSFDQKLFAITRMLGLGSFGVYLLLIALAYAPQFLHGSTTVDSDVYVELINMVGIAALVFFASMIGIGLGQMFAQWLDRRLRTRLNN